MGLPQVLAPGPDPNHQNERIGPRKMINRAEYIRLIQQSLHRLGYADVAHQLEQQSGIEMQPPQASKLQTAVMAGEWEAALQLLAGLTGDEGVLREARFLVLQQQYLEALEAQDLGGALATLRGGLAPLRVHQQQLHHLAGLLLCPPGSGAQSRSQWLGGGRGQRGALLAQLQAKLPPSLLLPEGRLEVLVEQALEAQVSRCPYHNALATHLTLLQDYQAGIESLPTQTVQVLEQHSDEVWHIAFSHGGTMLATASKDKTAIIWTLKSPPGSPAAFRLAPMHILGPHEQAVAFLSWAPGDAQLLTCSDSTLRLWDVATGQLLHTFRQHREAVTSCAWMPDGRRFLSGSVDKCIHMFDVQGNEVQKWKRPYRVQDMVVTHNGTCLIIACSDRQIHILRLSDQREVTLQESSPITSLALSPDSAWLLANLQSHTVRLWHLGGLSAPYPQALELGPDPMDQAPRQPSQEYQANHGKQGRYVLRSSFGGSEGTFVVHGSEDCQVYVWHRSSGALLLTLAGHAGTVNSVAWNPTHPFILASASDDKTVRIWAAAAAGLSRRQQ